MDAFGVLREVLDDYEYFVKGFLNISDERVRQRVEQEVQDALLESHWQIDNLRSHKVQRYSLPVEALNRFA